MNIEDKLKKQNWKRRIGRDLKTNSPYPQTQINNLKQAEGDKGKFVELTQSDFLDELDPNAHKIHNTTYRSNRPKIKVDEVTGRRTFDGWQEVSRVALGLQQSIRGKKVSFTTGGGIWFGNEGTDAKDAKRLETIKSYWNLGSFNKGFMQFGDSAFGTGDAAWYAYRNKNEVDFKVFSFEKGDTCISALDENGKEIFIRMFTYNDKQAVEIYNTKNIELWVKDSELQGIKKSDDGYVLISNPSHGLTQCPVAYHREPDVCWGVGQKIIERVEDIMSDLAENGKYYSFQILFLTGGVLNLPDSPFQGKVIASKTKDGDAKILAPADASNTFTLDLNMNLQFLWEITDTVIITPETLKGSNDSGAYLRTLYFKEIQWAMRAHARMHPALKKFVSIFKEIVGLIEMDVTGYSAMKLSYEAVPFIPSNELEETTIVTQQVAYKVLSRQTATGELDRGAADEYARIAREEKEPVQIPTPKIDNKAEGKDDIVNS